jgi:hypothetical protein
MSFVWLTGILAKVWAFIKPLIKSEIGAFLADKNVQNLAIRAVERAAHMDLDGDQKFDHATAILAKELKEIGIAHGKAMLAVAVEAAYQKVKAENAE